MNRRRFLLSGAGLGARGTLVCLCAFCSRRALFSAVAPFSGLLMAGCSGSESSAAPVTPPAGAPPAASPPAGSPPAASPPPAALPPTVAGRVSYLSISYANPENPAQNFGSQNDNMKHQALRVVGSGANRRLILWNGDYDACYPASLNRPGYKNEGTYNVSGRQEVWAAPVGDAQIGGGAVRFALAGNAYHNYPWTGSSGYFGPGAPGGGAEPQRGPYIPDATAFTHAGQFTTVEGQNWPELWMGPLGNNNTEYLNANWEIAGWEAQFYKAGRQPYSAMMKWTKPVSNTTGIGVAGVPLGNTWVLPPQQRLQYQGGTLGVDYDIPKALPGVGSVDSTCAGWGRVNSDGSCYDATTNRIWTMYCGAGSKTLYFRLYGFNLTPTAGQHTWTTSSVASIRLSALDILPDARYSSVQINWAEDGHGGSLTMSPQMIGRNIYFVILGSLSGLTDRNDANCVLFGGTEYRRTFARLFSINVDTLAVNAIPFPASQPYFLRSWDGPDALSAFTSNNYYGTPSQFRSLTAVGTRLVLGPDADTRISMDPWIQVYDTTAGTWASFAPPSTNDWPNSNFSLTAAPDLGEVWLMGRSPFYNTAWRASKGYHNPNDNAGRLIVRFKVT